VGLLLDQNEGDLPSDSLFFNLGLGVRVSFFHLKVWLYMLNADQLFVQKEVLALSNIKPSGGAEYVKVTIEEQATLEMLKHIYAE